MIIKAYTDNDLTDLILEMECDSVSPVSSYLIENNLKSAPEHYFDNSMLGYNTRINTKTETSDIEYLKNNVELDNELKKIMITLETHKRTHFTLEALEEANDLGISFFSNLYDNIKDEYNSLLDEVSIIELIFD